MRKRDEKRAGTGETQGRFAYFKRMKTEDKQRWWEIIVGGDEGEYIGAKSVGILVVAFTRPHIF